MFGTTRGTLLPAPKALLALMFALSVAAPIAARADAGMVDVRTLPRLEGAVEDTTRSESRRLEYSVPTVVAVTAAATRKLLAADGWVSYVRPLEENSSFLMFKKGNQGLLVSFTQGLGRPDQSVVYSSSNSIYVNVPFPDGAASIVFDERRPYLNCVAPGTVDANLDFFRKEFAASGWSPLSTAEAAARWPNVSLDPTLENGARAYFSRDVREGGPRQSPVMLSLQRRDDGTTNVEVKIAPFMLPQELELAREAIGLPVPNHTTRSGSTGSADSIRRKVEGTVTAGIAPVLAFYRRELAARNWNEEASGAVVTPDQVTLNFSSADQTATLKLVHKYDLTTLLLVAQVKEAALAARAKAKKEADAKFFQDAQATAKQMIAADEARRIAQAANLSDAPLRALADDTRPVPVPEGADNVKFDGAKGGLEFKSASSVKAVATFYRESMKSLGWKEQPSVINKSTMVVMNFTKGDKKLSVTAMQMGPRVNVSADGSGLVIAGAKSAAPERQGSNVSEAKSFTSAAAVQDLEAEPNSVLPVPKQHTMRMLGTGKMPGSNDPFRRELDASVTAELNSVLAFYRSELGKRGWKEIAERSVVKPDQVNLAFSSADGPAVLTLGRSKGETSIKLAQKYPAAAAKANIIPAQGRARLVFGNMGGGEVALNINKQTIKIAAGAGGPQSPDRPMLDLPPGKYAYSVKAAGKPARNDSIEVTADDAWAVMISPIGEVLSLQLY